eukprot:gnl/Chilomastix_caulleri/5894.p1 GENE.gnl/Chilomastix_caulleri/5894~~gnl/Chilomastix_caulleri/5894.p1  ORF type:complete len:58 (+),score=4.64 gnl/Chilomastix_caulleri/5894:107-280(+)
MKPYEVACVELAKLAEKSEGFSGRTMRKLGFVSLAKIWELSKQNFWCSGLCFNSCAY